jgi:hypothetical protein
MQEMIGPAAVYIIFGCFAGAGLVGFLWLAWVMVAASTESQLAPFVYLVRKLRRR